MMIQMMILTMTITQGRCDEQNAHLATDYTQWGQDFFA